LEWDTMQRVCLADLGFGTSIMALITQHPFQIQLDPSKRRTENQNQNQNL